MSGGTFVREAHSAVIDAPPSWARQYPGREGTTRELVADGMPLSVVEGLDASLFSVRVPNAVELGAEEFQRSTTSVYSALKRVLKSRPGQHPVRVWNYIPRILEPLDPFPQRYMAFNAGRIRAFEAWQEPGEELSKWVPTSSAVGNSAPDLVVHALTCTTPSVPIENRRQISSYRYSRRWGPSPPCFSRAIRLVPNGPESAMLMIGGTASVVGEETLHPGDLRAQIHETLRNLETLIRVGLPEWSKSESSEDVFRLVRQLRVYCVRREDWQTIDRAMRASFAAVRDIEYTRATLCREGLVVEIEGLASGRPSRTPLRAARRSSA